VASGLLVALLATWVVYRFQRREEREGVLSALIAELQLHESWVSRGGYEATAPSFWKLLPNPKAGGVPGARWVIHGSGVIHPSPWNPLPSLRLGRRPLSLTPRPRTLLNVGYAAWNMGYVVTVQRARVCLQRHPEHDRAGGREVCPVHPRSHPCAGQGEAARAARRVAKPRLARRSDAVDPDTAASALTIRS
jgi:hypothetical protein